MTIANYITQVQAGTLEIQNAVSDCLRRAHDLNPNFNAVLRFQEGVAEQDFAELKSKPLAGLPMMIKDNILIEGQITSCASKMLKNYVAPYSATCIKKLQEAGAVFLGQTNMDEFAMGGANENSAFGACKNPYGTDRIPGGSSGGSAVAVAVGMAMASLGTDTGGSVRQPASMCGIVGFKPTYGAISRYGVVAMASSLDQVGIFTQTVADSQALFEVLAGYDANDATSDPRADEVKKAKKSDSTPAKFFVPEEAINEGLDPQIKALFLQKIDQLRALGHQVEIGSFPTLKQSLAMYYTLMPSEVSANLSRFDGIRFGQQGNTEEFANLSAYYAQMRSEGFGEEVKRRILLGTYILSSANYESYYLKAQHEQQKLKSDFSALFAEYDGILTPTSPEVARKIATKSSDPLKMYLADLYTVPANLAGLPAISVPMGHCESEGESLPIGIHLMCEAWQDQKLFALASVLEGLKK